MSGSPAIRALYDLLMYWAVALLAAMIGTPTRIPPLLFYLLFGAILGNLNLVERGEGIEFFAEWSITVVFFSLGFEETVEHFLEGVRKAWGIALIGALVPFGCGYLCGYIFWPEYDWKVHLTIAVAVTATAVSLTMIVLQSVGLLKSRSSMGIMTSAVLDDVGCLILVAIIIPIIVSASQTDPSYSLITPSPCAKIDQNAKNISAVITVSTFDSLAPYTNDTSVEDMLSAAVRTDFMNLTNVPSHLIEVSSISLAPVFNVSLHIRPSSEIGVVPESVSFFADRAIRANNARNENFWSTDAVLASLASTRVVAIDLTVADSDPPAKSSVKVLDIVWIVGKVVIFFIVVIFLHNVVLPHDVTSGPIAHIPGVRSYGIKHVLQLFGGVQAPLIIVTFGLGLGMVGAALGFHPAVGAYFGGLLLEESYFDVEIEQEQVKGEEANEPMSPAPSDADAGPSPGKGRQYAVKNAPEDDMLSEFEVETPNTMEHAKDTVGSASFMWLGPVFFVHLGSGLEIDTSLLATAIPQALGIFAILWVGQFISATVSARYVPGGFDWVESALVGFGMLGRAELYFVVLNIAKTEGIFTNEIFFPMAVAAMFMNITLPICISAYKPIYARYHPEDVAGAEVKKADGEHPAIAVPPTPTEPTKRRSAISRRGIGLATVEMDPESDQLISKPPVRQASRLNRSPSRQSSRLSRGPSRLGRRSNMEDIDYFAEMPEMPAEYAGREPHSPGRAGSPGRAASPARAASPQRSGTSTSPTARQQ